MICKDVAAGQEQDAAAALALFTCVFLDPIEACGLALGPQLASLALALMLVPVVAGCIIFPNGSDWRLRFAQENHKS